MPTLCEKKSLFNQKRHKSKLIALMPFLVSTRITAPAFLTLENLLAMEYELDMDSGRKHPVIHAIGDKQNTRMERLGENYMPDSIYNRILSQPFHHIQNTNDQYVVWRNQQENEIRNIPCLSFFDSVLLRLKPYQQFLLQIMFKLQHDM